MGSVGFKEWAAVCEALGRGEQCVILRKGGIAEGRGGFAFKHDSFYLFPTLFHEAPGRTRLPDAGLPGSKEIIKLAYFARIEQTRLVTAAEVMRALTPLHILQEEVVQERFHWGGAKSIHVALVRVFRVVPMWTIPNERRYGGCRSWVNLPDAPSHDLAPVLSDVEHLKRVDRFRNALASASHD